MLFASTLSDEAIRTADMPPGIITVSSRERASSSATRRRESISNAMDRKASVADVGLQSAMTGNLQSSNLTGRRTNKLSRDSLPAKPRRKRLPNQNMSLSKCIMRLITRRTWALPLAMLSVFVFIYALSPSTNNPVYGFLFLSYRIESGNVEQPVQYGKGKMDLAFVLFYTIFLSFTRELIMQEILQPLAQYAGIQGRGRQTRFAEQAYTAIYYVFLGPFGMYVMRNSPVWYFNVSGMYEGFPHKTHNASFKFYYLFQAAFWAQQAIVLIFGLEKRRKDFGEMIAHHIVTLSLIGLSYHFHFTYIGIAVYITHDISDFFLASSKMLSYLDSSFTVPFYACFMCVWIYLRHYINIRILISLFIEYTTIGPYELDWASEQYKCPLSQAITAALLGSLQMLNLIWLYYYIFLVAYRITVYNERRDVRSDDEDSDVEK